MTEIISTSCIVFITAVLIYRAIIPQLRNSRRRRRCMSEDEEDIMRMRSDLIVLEHENNLLRRLIAGEDIKEIIKPKDDLPF